MARRSPNSNRPPRPTSTPAKRKCSTWASKHFTRFRATRRRARNWRFPARMVSRSSSRPPDWRAAWGTSVSGPPGCCHRASWSGRRSSSQTKFTFRRGQDHRLPYDPDAPVPIQVEQSLTSSLGHLGVEWVDSLLLHGPTSPAGLTSDDWAAWRAMEGIHDTGRARMLGVSNFKLEQLQCLWQQARVRPRFVQNRCYAVLGWDRGVREFCQANGVVYQGFSLLTANRQVLAAGDLAGIAARHGRTIPQIVFRFALEVGIIPLTYCTLKADAKMPRGRNPR